jgi:hypothetical protein
MLTVQDFAIGTNDRRDPIVEPTVESSAAYVRDISLMSHVLLN